ncbi:MAG: pyridoxamine 5'-phosphate oxidase family protein [Gordonia sp. (in: high G+C Gram-positive bacteria)]
MPSLNTAQPDVLSDFTRKPERRGDRELLDEILDSTPVGVLSTVVDGWPWSVPMLFARDGDHILLHGSTGAGALRQVAAGAPVSFTVFLLDGIVVADTLFDHSANYRSAVVRGRLETVVDDPIRTLEVLSDKLIPDRVKETPAITRKEQAATLTLRLPIVDGEWLVKARSGGPGVETDVWTGVVPVRTVYDEPITYTGSAEYVPESVLRLRRDVSDVGSGA